MVMFLLQYNDNEVFHKYGIYEGGKEIKKRERKTGIVFERNFEMCRCAKSNRNQNKI